MASKYTRELLSGLVARSRGMAALRAELIGLGHAANRSHLKYLIQRYGISTDHWGVTSPVQIEFRQKLPYSDVLVMNRLNGLRETARTLRGALLEAGMPYQCQACGLNGMWNQKSLTLQIDHLNGNCLDNRIENLRFLCPNCHSQTPTHSKKK